MKSLDQSAIRRQNVRRILDLLTVHSPRTRQSLAEATGLSLMTVTNLVDLLKEQNVLELIPAERNADGKRAYGRKAENISLRGRGGMWLIVDLSGKNFRYLLLEFDTTIVLENNCTAQGDYLPRLTAFLERLREEIKAPLNGHKLLGVSIVAPGPYEISSDTICNQRLPELNSVRIKELLRRHLGDYDYYVDEDVKFAVRAFSSLIEQKHCELLYYLFIGEGVGGASVHSGDMLRGLNATAGDAGQLTTPSGATFESLLSLPAFAQNLGCTPCTLQSLRQFASEQPEAYLNALYAAADITCDMLYNVLWVLDPSHVIIDCRYAQTFEAEYIQRIQDNLTKRFAASCRRIPVLSPAPQGMSSVARGAVQVLQRGWVERLVT